MKTALQSAALSLAFTLPLMAGNAAPNTSKEPYSGRIIYTSNDKVTVKSKEVKTSTLFKLAADTKVTLNGEPRSATELKKGWKAVVTPKADDPSTAASLVVTTSSNR
jgi:hypothetical protein